MQVVVPSSVAVPRHFVTAGDVVRRRLVMLAVAKLVLVVLPVPITRRLLLLNAVIGHHQMRPGSNTVVLLFRSVSISDIVTAWVSRQRTVSKIMEPFNFQ